MIEIGKIYKFLYKPNNIIYGLVYNIDANISIIPLNGFLGNQYQYYNVMRIRDLVGDKIISNKTSKQIYKKFIPYAQYIVKHILNNDL